MRTVNTNILRHEERSASQRHHVSLMAFLVLLSLFCLPCSEASGRPALGTAPGQSERIVAVQLFDLTARTEAEFTTFFSGLKHRGINTVFMRLFQNNGPVDNRGKSKFKAGVYFKSGHAPLLTDLLGPACKAARATGISLYGWMTTRNCDWFINSNREWQDERYNLETRTKEFYPRLDIFHPGFRKEIVALYADLAAYDLAGILVQDDCVLRQNEAFSAYARQAYYRETGRDLDAPQFFRQTVRQGQKTYVSHYGKSFFSWRDWKIDKLFEFVTELGLTCKRKHPGLKLAMNFYYELLSSPEQARTWYAHDLKRARNSPLDLFTFMAYQRQMATELNRNAQQIATLLETMTITALTELNDPARVLMKIQTRDWDTGRSIDQAEIQAALRAVNRHQHVGVVLVPHLNALDFETLLSTLTPTGQPDSP